VGENEASITLTVRATAVDNPEEWGEREIKVRGWHELSGNLEGIISLRGINALAYGTVNGGGRWVVAGEHPDSTGNTRISVIAYSDDNGTTWKKTNEFTNAGGFDEQEVPASLIYDGPEGGKKFVLGTSSAGIYWSDDGITWTKNANVFNHAYPRGSRVLNVVYGEVVVDGVPTGMYIATWHNGEYASSNPMNWAAGSQNWEKASMMENMTKSGEPVDLPERLVKAMDIRYGTGIINGDRTGMFFAQWIAPRPPGSGSEEEEDMYLYSTDGFHWEALATEIKPELINHRDYWESPVDKTAIAALNFKPSSPAGGHNGVYSLTVAIDTNGETLFAGDDAYGYDKKVAFAVVGGGYIMAVGEGRRLAIAHEGAYTITDSWLGKQN
jgi:hypothetical protein